MLKNESPFSKIGIVGAGVVGGALRCYLDVLGREPVLYDPPKGFTSAKQINECDLVFVCVPTPYVSGRGFDASALDDAFSLLTGEKTVVIKSTVLPGTTERFHMQYPQHRVLFNPEFLREATAVEDFLSPDRQIVGYGNTTDIGLARSLLELLPTAPHEAVVPARAAEMAKYATNSFLAMKVIFANELHDLCTALGIDYEDVKRGFAIDSRIGASHLDVTDGGYRGYAGKCLPKDTMSLLDLAEDLGVPMSVLEAAHAANCRLRAPVGFDRRGAVTETAVEPTEPVDITTARARLRERVA